MGKDTEKKEKRGQPSKYTKEIAERICNEIATTSKGLTTICKGKDMPCVRTVHHWLADESHEDFLHNYARARESQADFLAEQIIEIADNSTGDVTITESGKVVMDGEFAARSRLKVDARKWVASKLAPKKYGDRIQQDVSIHQEPPLFPDVKE